MEYYILDRWEGDFAVCETNDGMVTLARERILSKASEGDLLYQTTDGWVVDEEATAVRRQAILEKKRRRICPENTDFDNR